MSAKGTCNILRDDAWLFSPSLGLLAFNQPALLANVRCLRSESSVTSTSSTASSSSHKSFRNEPKFPLLRDIFYQREDSITNRRYGPLQPVGSRSLPLYWLRPSDIGAVVGLSVSSRNLDGKLSTTDIDKALVSFGVECNRYRGEYTGVSLERYRRLIRLLGNEYNTFTTQKHTDDKYIFSSLNGFGFAAIAWLVWEKASSKAELLEYLTALNKYSEIDMFTESAANSLGTESGRNGWIEESFIESELGLNTIQVAIERLLQSPHQQQSDKNKLQHQHELSFGQALEVVAASLSLETSVKPTLKLGRYTFTSISTDSIVPKTTPNVTVSASMKALKPDCVEVTIREILEALIYGR